VWIYVSVDYCKSNIIMPYRAFWQMLIHPGTRLFCYLYTGLFKMTVGVLTTCHTQYTSDSSICIFYLIEQHSKFLLHTLQVLYMCTFCDSTGLFEIIVGVLTTCHTQHTWDSSICIFLFNRTTLQVSVTYLTGALYVHHLWFYRVIRNDCQGFNNLPYTIHFR